MQKGEKNKLNLLLIGIKGRLEQNKDFFVSLTMEFKSGKKSFIANVELKDNALVLKFQGVEKVLSAKEITEFFANEVEKYEEGTLTLVERAKQTVISCTSRGVQMKQQEREVSEQAKNNAINPLLDSSRQYLIQVDKAPELLKEIGILTEKGKIKNDMIRKYNQIDHYVELVAPMFANDDSEEILLLDCACGKSYLSFVMNYYICEVLKKRCRIIGIDYNEHVVIESRKMAKRLGYHNMEFLQADLNVYQPPENVTGVISLHACDIATDLALGTAIRAKAKYIACVPCCHKELLDQYTLPNLEPLIKHGVFRARFNDAMTDSMRALRLEAQGYKVSVIEYVSPLDTPKNLLIRATYKGKADEKAQKAYDAVRALLGTYSTLDRF